VVLLTVLPIFYRSQLQMKLYTERSVKISLAAAYDEYFGQIILDICRAMLCKRGLKARL